MYLQTIFTLSIKTCNYKYCEVNTQTYLRMIFDYSFSVFYDKLRFLMSDDEITYHNHCVILHRSYK